MAVSVRSTAAFISYRNEQTGLKSNNDKITNCSHIIHSSGTGYTQSVCMEWLDTVA